MFERIRTVKGDTPGPEVVILSGLHGNEAIGVDASTRVFESLVCRRFAGQVHFVCGNIAALEAGRRYLERDLNRLWKEDSVAAATAESSCPEVRELFALREVLRSFFESAGGERYLIDLHGTSGDTVPFGIVFDSGSSRELLGRMLLPEVSMAKFEGFWTEVSTAYAARRGVPAIVIEAGPLSDPGQAEVLEACLWDALCCMGVVGTHFERAVAKARGTLRSRLENVPKKLVVTYEHLIHPDSNFRMRPGFRSFQWVSLGEELADERSGVVRAPYSGYLLFPLYQGQGDYGFAMARAEALS